MVTLLELERSFTAGEIDAGLREINKNRDAGDAVTDNELRAALAAVIFYTQVQNAKQP